MVYTWFINVHTSINKLKAGRKAKGSIITRERQKRCISLLWPLLYPLYDKKFIHGLKGIDESEMNEKHTLSETFKPLRNTHIYIHIHTRVPRRETYITYISKAMRSIRRNKKEVSYT